MAQIQQVGPKNDWIGGLAGGLQQALEQQRQQKLAIAQSLINSGQYQPQLGGPQPNMMQRMGQSLTGPQLGQPNMNVSGMNFKYMSPQDQAMAQAQTNAAKIKATMSALGPTLGNPAGGMNPSGMEVNPTTGNVSMSYKQANPNQPLVAQKTQLEIQKLQQDLGVDPNQKLNLELQQRQANLEKSRTELEMDKQKLSSMNKVNPQDVRFKQENIDLRQKQIQMEQMRIDEAKKNMDASSNGTLGMDLNKSPQELQQDLKSKNPSYANYLKSLADGKMTMGGRSTKAMMQVQKDLSTLYPGMDMSKIQARYNTRKDFTTGTASKNIKSLNTAVGHLNEMNKIIPELNNSNVKPWNQLAQTATREFGGNPTLVKFQAIKTALSGELSNIYKNSGGTDSEIKQISDTIDSADSPESMKASVNEAISLMGGRLSALQDQWHNAYDREDDPDFPVISPRSRSTLKSIGSDGSINNSSQESSQSKDTSGNDYQSYLKAIGQ